MSHYAQVMELLTKITPEQQVRFAIECAEKVMFKWNEGWPNDLRPSSAIYAAKHMMPAADIERAAIYAFSAALTSDAFGAVEAGHAARSAQCAAMCAALVKRQDAGDVDDADSAIAFAAAAADRAADAAHPEHADDDEMTAERAWQLSRLRNLIGDES